MKKIEAALFEACEQLEREKGIPKEVLISSLCDAMVAAYKKQIKNKEKLLLIKLKMMKLKFHLKMQKKLTNQLSLKTKLKLK